MKLISMPSYVGESFRLAGALHGWVGDLGHSVYTPTILGGLPFSIFNISLVYL